MEISFSVIIPAFNAGLYIAEAIESALNQIDVKAEIIVVNDGSTDNTLDILAGYGDSIKIFNQENKGLAAARNQGVKISEGSYIAFLDADDIWMPDKLKIQREKILDSYDIVYTNRINFGSIGDLPEVQSDVTKMVEGDIWEELLMGNMITVSSSIIKRELFERVNGFDESLRSCEDWDLWLRCTEKTPVAYCPKPLVKYRMHPNSLSKNYVFMSQMREQVISRSLNSERGRKLYRAKKQKALALIWACSGCEAARAKNFRRSLKNYARSLFYYPFSCDIWYDLARSIGRRF
jgi:teichuronic acid biosynthesis glycosyltransferase TuaG